MVKGKATIEGSESDLPVREPFEVFEVMPLPIAGGKVRNLLTPSARA